MDRKSGYCTKAILALPLRTPDRKVVGVLELINKEGGGHFDSKDVHLCTQVGQGRGRGWGAGQQRGKREQEEE